MQNGIQLSFFTDIGVTVFRRSDDSVAFKGVLEGQLYLVDFDRAELDTCLIANTNMGWLWHRRLAHVGMKNLHKLLKGEHILGLTNVHFEKDRVCSALKGFLRRTQNEFGLRIKKIRSDNETEFKNSQIEGFLEKVGIKHEFSSPYTP
jgi:hypothetical protein